MNDLHQRRLAAIVSMDVVGYSKLMGRDEVGTVARLRQHRAELIDDVIARHGGRIVKTLGDGLLLEYPSVVQATQSMLEVQTGMADRQDTAQLGPFEFRVGINLGDVIIDGDDILGDGVNIAARLQEIAEPGGIAISARVYEEIQDRLTTSFRDLGVVNLKNIERPIEVWHWDLKGQSVKQYAAQAKLEPVVPVDRQITIAVLPIENHSNQQDLDQFCKGLEEGLGIYLSQSGRYQVASKDRVQSILSARAQNSGETLNMPIKFLVEGSVQAMAGRMRINMRLSDNETGTHVWAESYDNTMEDLFSALDEVIATVLVEIDTLVDMGEMAKRRLALLGSSKAYGIYQKAYGLTVKGTRQGVIQARKLFQELATISDTPAVAYGGLLSCHRVEIACGWSSDPEEAIEYCVDLGEKGLDELPTFSFLRAQYAVYLSLSGRVEESVVHSQQAVDAEPTYGNLFGLHGLNLLAKGDWVRAARAFQSYFQLIPNPGVMVKVRAAFLEFVHDNPEAMHAMLVNTNRTDTQGLSAIYTAIAEMALGREQEAKDSVHLALSHNAYLSMPVIARQYKYYQQRDPVDRALDLLRKAGLPES